MEATPVPNPDLTPALKPPPGLQSNFVDPPTLMPQVIIGSIFVIGTTTLFVSMRIFTRAYVIREFHIEDYFCILAWSGFISYSGVLIYTENIGFARHQWDISLSLYKVLLYWINILYILYSPTTLFAKLAVLFQIKRIFTTRTRNAIWWVIHVSIVLNVCVYVGLFFVYVFQCWPREAIWDLSVKGRCADGTSLDFAAGILNLISDIEALILPAWGIWHLRMPIRKKLSVYAVFAVGLFAIIVGIVGLYYRIILLQTPDFSWVCTRAAMLIISEMGTVIIVGCVPTLPKFAKFCGNGFSRVERTKYLSYKMSFHRFTNNRWRRTPGELTLTETGDFIDSESNFKMRASTDEIQGSAPPVQQGAILKTTQLHQTSENI